MLFVGPGVLSDITCFRYNGTPRGVMNCNDGEKYRFILVFY